ncbi:hypothetical protein Syun_004502 [Stephania yunnanensis]|uniref:Amino acid transporter transmembrane domain-containing protein n=1 Tax=Stephania yunnanensis TaxID=152371 RepID=A0AAP0Q1H7_9MAGN
MTILTLASEKKHRRSPKTTTTTTTPFLLPQTHHHYHQHHAEYYSGEGGFFGAVFNLSTTVVGAGIMALPAAAKELGLIPGVIMIVLIAVLTESSIEMVLRFGKASKASSYSGVVGDTFGGAGRTILQACIVVNNVGMLVVYMIIIGDVLSGSWADGGHHTGVIEGWFGQRWWTTRFALLLFTTLFVLAPLLSFRRLDSLRYTSALSVFLALLFVVIMAGIAILKMAQGDVGIPRLLPNIEGQASFWKLFTTFPVLVTAYICHYSIHPIENELKDPAQMKSIVRASMGLCALVYVATSFFGFVLFGEKTLDDVLANFDADLKIPYGRVVEDVVRMSYGVHLMLVFPIVFFSLRLNLDGLLFPYNTLPFAYDGKRFFSVTVGLMGFIFLGANFIPSIWDAFQFTGATAAVSIGFIFPAAIALRDPHGIASKNDTRVSWLMILMAVSSSTAAISSDLYSIFEAS